MLRRDPAEYCSNCFDVLPVWMHIVSTLKSATTLMATLSLSSISGLSFGLHIQVFSYSEWRMRVDECESCAADVFFEDWCESWVLNDLADQSICQDECFGSVFGEPFIT